MQGKRLDRVNQLIKEEISLVLQRERMTGPLNLPVHKAIGQRKRPIPIIDGTRDLFNRTAVGVHGIPHAKEVNFLDVGKRDVFETGFAHQIAAEKVTNGAQHVQVKAR